MAISTTTKIFSVKEQLDDLESRFEKMLNDEHTMDLIKVTHEDALLDSKHEFKQFVDSYTKSQIFSIESEKNIAINDIKIAASQQSQILETVSILPLSRDVRDYKEESKALILKLQKENMLMKVVCAVSLIASILGIFL